MYNSMEYGRCGELIENRNVAVLARGFLESHSIAARGFTGRSYISMMGLAFTVITIAWNIYETTLQFLVEDFLRRRE